MTRPARIYRPAKNPMQSGTAKSYDWVLEFEPANARFIDHVMGWTGSSDMTQELSLYFPSKEEAIRYAESKGIPFTVIEPHARKLNIRAYADNFSYSRIKAHTSN